MTVRFYNRYSSRVEKEKVYGDKLVNWLYDTPHGRILSPLLAFGPLSSIYGRWQDHALSARSITPFVKAFDINMDEFLPEDGAGPERPYSTFNNFFVRRFKEGARSFVDEQGSMPAPAEARYFGFLDGQAPKSFPVKGKFLDPVELLQKHQWDDTFRNGPALIARLCPVDYHRFHFPDEGQVLDQHSVAGALHSVNPVALKSRPEVFITNERRVTILQTRNFGKLAYIEVGAMCVGKIVQTFEGKSFKRGQEKGLFLFGGSTVILLGEKGVWVPSQDITENTKKGLETYVKLGHPVARKSDLL
jgi:phosphatidylserine decarboxylase